MSDVAQLVGRLLAPRSVAVIGASEDASKFGGRLYRTLLKHGYAGTVYPINPVRERLLGLRTCASVADTPEPPDMVVMAVPRAKVLAEIRAAAARGARGGIVITAKFADAGAEGAALERELVAAAHARGMRLIGPNCLGVISPANGVVLCSSPALDVDVLPVGRIGLVSQSGALMATLFDRARAAGVGFSHCVSVGNQADLELADFVEFMIDDPATDLVCSYVEGLKDPVRFVELAARAREAGKPWLMVKAGRTEAGTQAAFSHTASIAGSHAVLASVCRDEQVTMLDDPASMIALAAVLVRHRGARVSRVSILTTSGGGGALAADALAARGVALARYDDTTRGRLAALYPRTQANNPVDFGGRLDDSADVTRDTARIVADDAATDAVLTAITTAPALPALAASLADGLADAQGRERKPAFQVFQMGAAGDAARAVLRARGVPYVDSTGEAIDALAAWAERSRHVARTAPARPPGAPVALGAPGRPGPEAALDEGVLDEGVLDEHASKALLARYGVPVNAARVLADPSQAAFAALSLGWPVAIKVVSPDIVHKSDVGGVVVGLRDAHALADACTRMLATVRERAPHARIDGVSVQAMVEGDLELIVGARADPQFGPIVVVGAGGVLVELLGDRLVARAPIAAADVRRLLESLAVAPLLLGWRGRALAIDAVVDAIVRVSWLAHDLRARDFELDVNPLMVSASGCCAVDARLRIGR